MIRGMVCPFYELDFSLLGFKYSGTKNVAKMMGKIAKGKVSCKDVTWFPQLADKSKLVNKY